MCDSVHRLWYGKTLSPKELAELFFENIDFCLDFHWPSANTLRELLGENNLRDNGIIADDKWSVLNRQWVAVIGNSEATLRYNALNAGTVYVCDGAKVNVFVKGRAFVVIHAYDDANVSVVCDDTAKATVIIHSKFVKVSHKGQITKKECSS